MRKLIIFFIIFNTHTLKTKASTLFLQDLKREIPSIALKVKYSGNDNFLSQKVPGYQTSRCLLASPVIKALKKVQKDLKSKNLGLKVFDCYRPQKAVDFFKTWITDGKKAKNYYLANLSKSDLIKQGYVASRSSHSRGSTVDLTIVRLDQSQRPFTPKDACFKVPDTSWGSELNMGTAAGCFHPYSHTHSKKISKGAQKNRKLLLSTMEKHGFRNYSKEWWHYTYKKPPYPTTYFDFDIKDNYDKKNSLDEIFNKVVKSKKNFSNLYSFILFNQNSILFEKYYNSFSPEKLANIKSASKSILSLILGKAIEQEKIRLSDELKGVPLKYMLSMNSGFYPTSRKNYAPWVQSKNWVQYILKKPLVQKPGSSFEYSTGNSHLVSYMLTQKVNDSVESYAKENLFTPLSIKDLKWDTDPQGINFGGNNLYLKARDLAKIGVMLLKNGRYNDQSVISNDWIERSIRKHSEPPKKFIEFKTLGYGYFWWNLNFDKNKGHCALGYGGQFLCFFPGQNLGFVTISKWFESNPRPYYKKLIPWLEDLF